jgi:plasmid stabilization system protein ParE
VRGLERCRVFLAERNPRASHRAALAIERNLARVETTPELGRPLADLPELRELPISFGDSGYVALYRFDPALDTVYVLAFRHQKEAGY